MSKIPIRLYIVYVTLIVGSLCSGNIPKLHASKTINSSSTVFNEISMQRGIVEFTISPISSLLVSFKTSGTSWTARLNCVTKEQIKLVKIILLLHYNE